MLTVTTIRFYIIMAVIINLRHFMSIIGHLSSFKQESLHNYLFFIGPLNVGSNGLALPIIKNKN